MEEWVIEVVKEERAKRGKPMEAKKIGNNYYLYEETKVWLKGREKKEEAFKVCWKNNSKRCD
jgi:hypothetical protein